MGQGLRDGGTVQQFGGTGGGLSAGCGRGRNLPVFPGD